MREIGEEIQRARLNKGVNLEEIVTHTHIQLAHLQKIENGQFDFLPRPYVTAFIKTFAQYVGLNGEALVIRWHEQEQAEAQRLQEQYRQEAALRPAEESRRAPAIFSLKSKVPATATPVPVSFSLPYLKEILISFGILAMAGLIFLVSRAGDENAGTEASQSVKQANPAELRELPFEQVSQQMQQLTQPDSETVTPPPSNELTLHAQFENQTRVRLVRDGKDTTIVVYRAGEAPAWQAKEKFNLRLSAGGAVNLRLGNRNLGKFGQPGKVEFLTIKREGVTERRFYTPQPTTPKAAVPLDNMPIRRPQR